MIVSGAVEGMLDDAVLRRILRDLGHEAGAIHVKNGKPALLQKLDGYNAAARLVWWVVLVDLNGDTECAPAFVAERLPPPQTKMVFCIAVRQVESWLLADAGRLARFLGVSRARLPSSADSLDSPKRTVVEIARHSNDRRVREALVPGSRSGRSVGPGYVAAMIEFVERSWDPTEAAQRSESLQRCLRRLSEL